jgi:hypothetical protein
MLKLGLNKPIVVRGLIPVSDDGRRTVRSSGTKVSG